MEEILKQYGVKRDNCTGTILMDNRFHPCTCNTVAYNYRGIVINYTDSPTNSYHQSLVIKQIHMIDMILNPLYQALHDIAD